MHKILSWQNVYNIVYSQAVTHPSTNTTQCCLTSVIGRELVLSTWYGRRRMKQTDILCHLMRKVRLSLVCVWCLTNSPGVLACSCNPATWRQVLLDGLLWGFPITISTCWSGVRTKACINMHLSGDPERSRLTKEWRKGPGGKPSSQKSPCESVVGQRQRVAGGYLPYCKPDSELFIAICHMNTEQTFAPIRVISRK